MTAHPGVTGRKPPRRQSQASGKRNSIRGPPTPTACHTVASFCAAYGISESMFYKMKAEGWGPREAKVGARILITFESAAAWLAEREASVKTSSTSNAQAPSPAA